MPVFFAIPSAAPLDQARECFQAWRDMGYGTAAICEDDQPRQVDLQILQSKYGGYSTSVNKLVRIVLVQEPDCKIVVIGGDDVYPDQTLRAKDIEGEFLDYFKGTFGVMQPSNHSDWSFNASLLAWSPWLGREWCLRAYGGQGVLWPEYHHLYVDRELRLVTERDGVFWDRHDLRHEHRTWRKMVPKMRPQHLQHIENHILADRSLFATREKLGFPGSELVDILVHPGAVSDPAPVYDRKRGVGAWLWRLVSALLPGGWQA